MKSDQAPILLGVLIFVLHLPVLVALGVVVLGLVAASTAGRLVATPERRMGLVGCGPGVVPSAP